MCRQTGSCREDDRRPEHCDSAGKTTGRLAPQRGARFRRTITKIYGKYEKVYKNSLDKIKSAREIFINDLREIKELQVFDSQANYILIKILEKYSSEELTKILLNDYEIYIKDLKGKAGIDDNFIRIAVRDIEDNKYCINALKEIFERER